MVSGKRAPPSDIRHRRSRDFRGRRSRRRRRTEVRGPGVPPADPSRSACPEAPRQGSLHQRSASTDTSTGRLVLLRAGAREGLSFGGRSGLGEAGACRPDMEHDPRARRGGACLPRNRGWASSRMPTTCASTPAWTCWRPSVFYMPCSSSFVSSPVGCCTSPRRARPSCGSTVARPAGSSLTAVDRTQIARLTGTGEVSGVSSVTKLGARLEKR
jgi:hypothetical protein